MTTFSLGAWRASGNGGFVVFFTKCKKTDNGEEIFYVESVGLVLYNIYYSALNVIVINAL